MCARRIVNARIWEIMWGVTVAALFLAIGCSGDSAWKSRNDRVIAEKNVTVRTRGDIPKTGVVPNLEPGRVIKKAALPDVELAPGVTAKIYWGKGALVAWVTMAPGSEIPREELPGERVMLVTKGSLKQLVSGRMVDMRNYDTVTDWTSNPHMDMVYLAEGSMSAVGAGDEGAEFVEIYRPVRADYIEKAGGKKPRKFVSGDYNVTPSIPSNKVMNYYDIQFTDLSRKTLWSRVVTTRGVQLSFLSGEPGRVSDFHCHPEEQLMIVLRGSIRETIMDTAYDMEPGDIAYLPANMVHRGEYGSRGCDALDVFWPPRADIIEKQSAQLERFHAIIPEDARPVLEHDGEKNEPKLNFTEGPAWMDGALYFSNMWFAADWSAGDPRKSNLIKMTATSIEVILRDIQTNGIMPLGNGNLAVCDMFGHRLIEVAPNGGIVRTLAAEYDGVRLDGPNDLVIDAKGGIYFTDPQFTPGLDKTQPGKAVYYLTPNGRVIRVVDPGEFGQPNGVLLSPDGKTLYISNTRNMPVGNYVAAYDVQPDGTLANKRNFAKLHVPPGVREQEAVTTGADGMTIDVHGNIYVATAMGLQIFDDRGEFIGMVDFPIRPVSAVFGGDDMQTIYCTCATRLYSIRTKVKGLEYPLR